MVSFTFHGCIYSLSHSSFYMRCWVRCRCLLLLAIPCIVIFALFVAFLVNYSDLYPSYDNCSPYSCNDSLIKYPFTDCGHTAARCTGNQTIVLDLTLMNGFCKGNTYRVVGGITESSYRNRTIHVASDQNVLDGCSATLKNVSYTDVTFHLYSNELYLSDKYKWGTVFICNKKPAYNNIIQRINCLECRSRHDLCYFAPWDVATFYYPLSVEDDQSCQGHYGVVIPNNKSYNISDEKNLRVVLQTGFDVKWYSTDQCSDCETSGGICYRRYYTTSKCICPDGPHNYNCSDGIFSVSELLTITSLDIF